MKNSIAIIPARFGSKRIKQKNIKSFLNKPIISYTIKTAIRSKLFSKIIVSTDNKKIANISKKYGATDIIFRPNKLSNDHAGTLGVIKHSIQKLDERGIYFDYVCCIYPCSVLINSKDLLKSYKRVVNSKHKFVFSSLKFSHPIQRGFVIKKNKIKFLSGNKPKKGRTQDMAEVYHDAGQFYWGRKIDWKKTDKILSNNCGHYLVPHNKAIDIDNIDDWYKAEALYSYFDKKKKL